MYPQICHNSSASGGGDDAGGGGRKGNWDCDGLNGPEDPTTSISILLKWWMTEGNYSMFCGKNNHGITKKQFCDQIAAEIGQKTKSKREGKSVLSKIQHIERTFREAHNFATSETGAGIKEQDEGSFEAAVNNRRRLCSHEGRLNSACFRGVD